MKNIFKYFNVITAVLAFVVWGGWAFYVNAEAGFHGRLISGFLQGVISMTVTLLMIKIIEFLYGIFSGEDWKFFRPAIVITMVMTVVLFVAHSLAGTENIAMTIIPNLFVVFMFGVLTTYKVKKLKNSEI